VSLVKSNENWENWLTVGFDLVNQLNGPIAQNGNEFDLGKDLDCQIHQDCRTHHRSQTKGQAAQKIQPQHPPPATVITQQFVVQDFTQGFG
jgi:hypothetical protein